MTTTRRVLALLAGVITLAFGIALNIQAGVGLDVLTAFQSGIANQLHVQVGTAVNVFNWSILVVFALLNRKVIGLGTFAICLFLGSLVNLFEGLLAPLQIQLFPYPARFACLAAGLLFVCLGLAWYVPLDMGVQPSDMVVLTIAGLVKKPYGTSMYIFQAVLLAGALLLGGAVGPGTIIGFAVTGYAINGFTRLLAPLHRHFAKPAPHPAGQKAS